MMTTRGQGISPAERVRMPCSRCEADRCTVLLAPATTLRAARIAELIPSTPCSARLTISLEGLQSLNRKGDANGEVPDCGELHR